MNAIETHQLSRLFEGRTAVDNLTLPILTVWIATKFFQREVILTQWK